MAAHAGDLIKVVALLMQAGEKKIACDATA